MSESSGNKILIVGSGPSAFAAAKMLEFKHISFDVFDAGLSQGNGSSFPENGAKGTLRKSIFGFKFPYFSFPHGPKIDFGNTLAAQSYARGGFSSVWGATMLPFTEKEFMKWPFRSDFLAHYYDFISEYVPISAVEDKLAKHYPMPKQIKYPLRPTLRFKSLTESPSKETPNTCIGLPRLAVRNGESFSNCVYCEKCITGCNYNLIWNTSGYWSRLPRESRYFSGRRVLKIFAEDGNNYVQWIDLENKTHTSGPYQKIFLGCGPLETFRIFSESTGAPRETRVLDSNIIFSPIFIGGRKRDEQSHTLAQAFLYLTDLEIGDINVQLYDYSDDLISRVKSLNSIARLLPNFILKWFLHKFIYCLIYLDSDDSSEIKLSISANGSMNLSEDLKEKNSSNQALKIVGDWCRNNSLLLIKPLAKKGTVGEGVHYGGSIPFGIEVKEDGEVSRFPGLYLIDSSTFPHIPAGPITFTIMANSARIVDSAS